MPENSSKCLPENAYTALDRRRRATSRWCPPPRALPELTWRSVRLGRLLLRGLHRGLRLLRAEGGPGDGGRHPDLDPGDRPGARVPAALHAARERHHHRHRRRSRRRGGGRDLHSARAVHAQARPAPGPDHLHLPGRRLPGRALPHPAAPLLRARHARPAALPRGHGHHRSAHHRREGRLAGQAAAPGHRRRRRLRLLRHHLPGVEGVRRLPVRAGRARRSPSAPKWPSASTPSASSSASATSWGCAAR